MGTRTEQSGRQATFDAAMEKSLEEVGIDYDGFFAGIFSPYYREAVCRAIARTTMGVGELVWNDEATGLVYLLCKPAIDFTFSDAARWCGKNGMNPVGYQIPHWDSIPQRFQRIRVIDLLGVNSSGGYPVNGSTEERVHPNWRFGQSDYFMVFADAKKRPMVAPIQDLGKGRHLLLVLEDIKGDHVIRGQVERAGFCIQGGYGQHGSTMEPPFPQRSYIAHDRHSGEAFGSGCLTRWGSDGTAGNRCTDDHNFRARAGEIILCYKKGG